MEKPQVTIIILNYNGKKDTVKCINSVLKTRKISWEILVIDNGSVENEAKEISSNFSQKNIRCFRLSTNLGFTGGNNWAIEKSKGKYVALLNNDTVVDPHWLFPLVEELERNKHTAVVQPKIRHFYKKSYFDYAGAAGGYIDKYGYPFTRGRMFETLEKDRGQYDNRVEIFWASGAACLIRKSIIQKVGGLFSENLFNYMEEIDFCWRVWNRGYKVMFRPESVVYHKIAMSSKKNLFNKRVWEHRNNLIILTRNLDRNKLISILPTRIFLEFLSYINYIYKGEYKYFFALFVAHFQYLKKFILIRYKRNRLKNVKGLPIYPGSIAIDYFVKGLTRFDSLNWSPKGNVSYLLFNTKESGGSRTVVKHILKLRELGYSANLFTLFRSDESWIPKEIKIFSFLSFIFNKKSTINIATFWPTAYFLLLKRSESKIYFVQCWEEYFYNNIFLQNLSKWSYLLPIKKITISKFLLKKLKSYCPKNHLIQRIQYNVLDKNYISPSMHIHLHKNQGKIYILSVVSWFNVHKGTDILIKVVRKLKAQNKKYKFILVSKENKTPSKVFDKFISNPSRSELYNIYKHSDYFISTSRSEGFFIPGLEAMATGAVFITTDSGGVRDYAKNLYNSVIVNNPEDFWGSNPISMLESNRKLKNIIIKNGYKTAKEYSEQHILQEFENILFP